MRGLSALGVMPKLVGTLLIASLVPLVIVSAIGLKKAERKLLADAHLHLESDREIKRSQIEDFFNDHFARMSKLHNEPYLGERLSALAEALAQNGDSQAYAKEIQAQRPRLKTFCELLGFREVFLIDPKGNIVLTLADESGLGANLLTPPLEDSGLGQAFDRGKHEVVLIDFSRHGPQKEAAMFLAAPLENARGEMIGVAAFEICIEKINQLMRERVGMKRSGETYLVGADNRMRSDSHLDPVHRSVAASFLGSGSGHGVDTEASRRALAGESGTATLRDYRGELVLSAFSPVNLPGGIRWAILAEIDEAEIKAPVRALRKVVILLTLVLAIVAAGFSFWIGSRVSRPIVQMTDAARRVAEGDLGISVDVRHRDEIGQLGDSFNQMASSLAARQSVHEGILEVSRVLAASSVLDVLLDESLKQLMAVVDCQVGAIYLAGAGGDPTLRLAATRGFGDNADLPQDVSLGEGLIGQAAENRSTDILRDIPDRTQFTVETIAGRFLPKSIMSVPLVLQDQLVGVVGMAGLYPISPEHREIVETSRVHLATAIANALGHDRTQRMAEQLSSSNTQLTKANAKLESQAEELRRQAEELEVRQKSAQQADRLKSEFLSNMSHELRTPLNSVMALSQLIISRGEGKIPEEDIEILHVIERNGRHLLHLINDILDLSKIEAGRMDLDIDDFEPHDVVQGLIETVLPLADEKGLILKAAFGDLPRMRSDAGKMSQILLNLLSNAIKFTEKGQIELDATHGDGQIRFAIRDSGSGISSDELDHIFERFQRVESTGSREPEGTGLGLAIGQKLARLLGGEITVESHPGHGSTFTLVLPIEHTHVPVASEPVSSRPEQPASSGTGRTDRPTVLVVDDELPVCDLLKNCLQTAGYEVVVAHNGRDALDFARRVQPGVITLDILMPDMDGWEVINQLKACEETALIPVVMVSVAEDQATGMAMGASAFLVKPIDERLLLEALERIDRMPEVKAVERILVVDDDLLTREQLHRVLAKRYDQVVVAEGGEEGLRLAAAHRPDAIVLDLMMPDLDGFAVLDRLRAAPATRDLPVVVLSAKDLTAEERNRLRDSVHRIITKGKIDKDRLLEEVQAALSHLEWTAGSPTTQAVPAVLSTQWHPASQEPV